LYSLSVIPEFIYRRVLIRGRWDHAHSMLVGPRTYDGTHGFHLITPLIRTDGTTVLVDRGFISKEQAQNPIQNLPEGEVQVLGMLRTSQPRNKFTPDNEPEKGVWYWIDADAMANYAGGAEAGVQPVFIEEIFGKYRLILYWLSPYILNRGSWWRSCFSGLERYTARKATNC
jgi:surfeit locus 1 family protein